MATKPIDAIGEFARAGRPYDYADALRRIAEEPARRWPIRIPIAHEAHADALCLWIAHLEASPTDFDILEAAIVFFMVAKSYDVAIELAERGIALDATATRWTSFIGFLHHQAGRPAEAIAAFERHVALAPTPATRIAALVDFERFLALFDDQARARTFAAELYAAGPEHPAAWHLGNTMLGCAAVEAGDRTTAAAHLVAAGLADIAIGTFTPDFRLARLLIETHRAEVAAFVEAVARWWTSDPLLLDGYRGDLAAGETPRFR